MTSTQAPAPEDGAGSRPPGGMTFLSRVNRVSTDRPWQWLAQGWADLRVAGWRSFAFGLIFVAAGYGLLGIVWWSGMTYLIWPLACGFVLVAPAYAVGAYETSRRIAAGEPISLCASLMAWRRNPGHILGTGLALTFYLILWIRFAALIYVLSFPYEMVTIESLVNHTFFSPDGLTFLGVGTIAGAIFATFAFLASAVSLPMMLGEKASFLPAVITSAAAVWNNPKAMAVWAAIIVVATTAGMATAMAGLAITLPLIGHATWHAYRDVIRPPEAAAST